MVWLAVKSSFFMCYSNSLSLFLCLSSHIGIYDHSANVSDFHIKFATDCILQVFVCLFSHCIYTAYFRTFSYNKCYVPQQVNTDALNVSQKIPYVLRNIK